MSVVVCINPGSGPVADASLRQARLNMAQFVNDVGVDAVIRRRSQDDGNGRFGFTLKHNGRRSFIEMPGIALARVRYVGSRQNIWDFPRLYEGESSWVWCFAVRCSRSSLGLTNPAYKSGPDDDCAGIGYLPSNPGEQP